MSTFSVSQGEFQIDGRAVGPSHPAYVIAEAGVNHNGDENRAAALIDAAAEAGADAVKFQTFRAKELVAPDTPRVAYQARNTGSDASQLDMLRALELPDEAFVELRDHARTRGVTFLSSPHTESAVEVLADLVPAFKIGSADLTNPSLLRCVGATRLPVVLGTGMSDSSEVRRAIDWLEAAGAPHVVPLHCTSNYPCPDDEVNLAAMVSLRNDLGRPVGYSDHTLGRQVPIMAATLGAVVIEKHFTLDRSLPGPDHAASMEPTELRTMVTELRRVPTILGRATKEPCASEFAIRAEVRKGLIARRDLEPGHVLTAADLGTRRPVGELGAERLDEIIGRTVGRPIRTGDPLRLDDLQ